jgi:hypothetical protein
VESGERVAGRLLTDSLAVSGVTVRAETLDISKIRLFHPILIDPNNPNNIWPEVQFRT